MALSTVSSFANQGVGADFSAQTTPAQGSSPGARFITDSRNATWADAVVNYYDNPSHQAAGISTDTVLGLIQAAGRKWENVCKVRFNYLGTQSAMPDVDASFATIDRLNVIGWMPLSGDRAGFDGYVCQPLQRLRLPEHAARRRRCGLRQPVWSVDLC